MFRMTRPIRRTFAELASLPCGPQVYVVKGSASAITGRPLWVGKTSRCTAERVGEHRSKGTGGYPLLPLFGSVEVRRTRTMTQADALERTLIRRLRPLFNRQHPH